MFEGTVYDEIFENEELWYVYRGVDAWAVSDASLADN